MKTIDRKVREEICVFEDKIREKIKLNCLAIDDIRDSIRVLKEQYSDVVVDIHSIIERLDVIEENINKTS